MVGKRSIGVVLGILFLTVTGGVLFGEPVRIGYVNVMDDASVLVAYEGGFYGDRGLEPRLTQFASGTDMVKAIVGGRIDVGVLGFTNALTWASRGASLRIVGGAQRGYHSLLARRDTGITDVSELHGRELASQKQGSTADIVLSNVLLADSGLSKRDLNMRHVSPAVAVQALVSGGVDAAFLFEPYARIARYTAPVREIAEVGDYWPFPCMVVITSAETWQENRSTIESVLEAQKEAIALLEGDPNQAAGMITHYFMAEETLETPSGPVPARRVVAEAIEANTFSWRLTSEDLERIKEVEEMMHDEGLLAQRVDLEQLLDMSWQQAIR
tara:strand:+ start:231 stop:1214 length:984 start_codon:yes stop_codon:yes gene_type:complete